MIAYLDLSVLLRVVLRQSNALAQWPALERGIGSALVEVECLRTLDRLRLAEGLADEEIAIRREAIFRIVEAMDIVELTRPVLARAAQPLPTALGTLDAIHLPTALLWRERTGTDLVMATHDGLLATAARASGLRAIGIRGGRQGSGVRGHVHGFLLLARHRLAGLARLREREGSSRIRVPDPR